VAGAFAVRLDASANVAHARLAFGGMAATPLRAKKLEAALLGKPWTLASIEAALPLLEEELKPLSDHRGSAAYRMRVAKNLLIGFHDETLRTPQPRLPHPHTATVANILPSTP
jgi:xanthine dehydrogenase small subunit